MSTIYISIYINIILGWAVVATVFGPKVIEYIKNKKKLRERQEKTALRRLIKQEVAAFMKDLQK
jgi:hypothetical protein